MIGRAHGMLIVGVEARTLAVSVEAQDGRGWSFSGVRGEVWREAAVIVESALEAVGCRLPARKYVVRVEPALPQVSATSLMVPLAVAAAEVAGLTPPSDFLFVGELDLSGALRPVRGVLPAAIEAARQGHEIVVPTQHGAEAALAGAGYAAGSLREILDFLRGLAPLTEFVRKFPEDELPGMSDPAAELPESVRAAVAEALTGPRRLLLVGPPGSGKTFTARRIMDLLGQPTPAEFIEINTIHSASGLSSTRGLLRVRPFRGPHHTISDVGLLGGGTPPRPGELSLAHGGVLFLDELPEFRRSALESIGAALDAGKVVLSRGAYSTTLPAKPALVVAAMNPCPCGFHGSSTRSCSCTLDMRARYAARAARFDPCVHVEMRSR